MPRYEKYPHLRRLVAAMSDEGRELVAHWHRVLTTALEGYKAHAVEEARHLATTPGEALVAVMAADSAVQAWLNTMRDSASLFADSSPADWCCKRGMMASPAPCPQHGWIPDHEYELGTVIVRPDPVRDTEKAVRVWAPDGGWPWASITYGNFLADKDLVDGGWTVVGRV